MITRASLNFAKGGGETRGFVIAHRPAAARAPPAHKRRTHAGRAVHACTALAE